MVDNVTLNPGTGGAVVASDDIAGIQYQRVKVTWGADGVANDASAASPLPTTALTNTELRAASVPVSASALPLPSGAATESTAAAVLAAFKAEDSVAVSGDLGMPMLAMRFDSDAATASDGDYTILKLDETGRLKVSTKPASYADITGSITAIQATISTPVAGGTVEGDVSRASNVMALCSGTFSTVNCSFEGSLESSGDTNWFSIQAVRSNANTIETTTGNLSAQPTYAWEMSVNGLARMRVRCTARTSGTQSWRFKLGTYATEPIPAAQISGTQPVSGTVTANWGTITTPTASNINSAATTNATSVKATAGSVYSITASNTGAGAAFLKLYNKASSPTVGTDVPVLTIPIPASSVQNIEFGTAGHRFTTGIALAITNLAADSDTTAIAANQVKVLTAYI